MHTTYFSWVTDPLKVQGPGASCTIMETQEKEITIFLSSLCQVQILKYRHVTNICFVLLSLHV
jgi:hypothetical protein